MTQSSDRRHDLDALRAFAMLLGIVLHAAISFIPGFGLFWGVQDSQANGLYGVVFWSIHGWRMPLFFLVSGFFTAMLWRKRGLRALLIHRFKRIFLPMMLGMVTIAPLMWAVSAYVRSQPSSAVSKGSDNDQSSTQITSSNQESGGSKIDVMAAVATNNQQELSEFIEQGGNVNAGDENGSTPLHVACLFGRAEAAELLLQAGADIDQRNKDGASPVDLLMLDWGTTAFIAQLFQVPVERDAVLGARRRIAEMIGQQTGRPIDLSKADATDTKGADRLMAGLNFLLFYFPVFHHLWFLWFLCWLVCGFAIVAKLGQSFGIPALSGTLVISPIRFLWLIPLTAVPQYFMGSDVNAYGPDTSGGLLPIPTVLMYYAIFFGYGALYFGSDDRDVRVGKGWWWMLPIATFVLFPIGLDMRGPESAGDRALFAIMQVSYTWAMSFAMIGLFHRLCNTHRFWVRYLYDSSYWLYLAHLPLVILLQFLVRDWTLASALKFAFVCLVCTGLLLASYQLFVRSTWIGAFLNGRRSPRRSQPQEQSTEEPTIEATVLTESGE